MTGRPLSPPHTLSAIALAVTLVLTALAPASAVAAPEGQMTWAVHVSLAPTWFDPAETAGIVTPWNSRSAVEKRLGNDVRVGQHCR